MQAIKRLYDRTTIFKDGTAAQIAMNAGWTFVKVEDLPDNLKEKVTSLILTHVWVHDRYLPIYAESVDIVRDYALSEALTYRQFRKLVQHGHDCLMLAWQGMWIGIEKDGYTHS